MVLRSAVLILSFPANSSDAKGGVRTRMIGMNSIAVLESHKLRLKSRLVSAGKRPGTCNDENTQTK